MHTNPLKKIRLTAVRKPGDYPRLVMLRRQLHACPSLGLDLENPAYVIRRDPDGCSFFELSTSAPDEVHRVVREYGHEGLVTAEEVEGVVGDPCLICGNIGGPVPPPTCPRCGFQEISSCPHCERAISRLAYESIGGDVYQCPECRELVQLRFNEPLISTNGEYNEPVIIVERAPEAAE